MIDRDRFEALAASVCAAPPGVDRVLLAIAAESSTFVRLNRARVRQATAVEQCQATLSLVRGRKRIDCTLDLLGQPDEDAAQLCEARDALARELGSIPDDPHLMLPSTVTDTCRDDVDDAPASPGAGAPGMPAPAALLDAIAAAARPVSGAPPLDLVGFHAQGPALRAFADSRGQRNWHRAASFHLEWCLYSDADPGVRDKAVKTTFAGRRWDEAEFARRFARSREQLAALARPNHPMQPGRVRALLAPAAVAELLGGLAWGGFGLKDRRTGTSSLQRLAAGTTTMSPQVRLVEATASGTAPAFTMDGFVRPDEVVLIERGRSVDALVSPRSAAEYAVRANADGAEAPHSLSLDGGTLPVDGALAALDSGILIGNLWYLNYSDRPACRMTGMTRFACFRVEHGRILAPIGAMRFDDSLLDLFGARLEALTDTPDLIPSGDTWGARDLGSIRCPAMLVDGLNLTL
ncbi:MAG: metallopeptidase TldD-related protein [Lautropia sp.]